jgi:CheY-like chemotaxis protein
MKILLVEDEYKHLGDAKKALAEAGVEVVTCMTSSDAIAMMLKWDGRNATPTVDGIITDLFLPYAAKAPWNAPDQACGLAVALRAEQVGIPFVICTAGYHHGAKYQWVHDILGDRNWSPMIDSYPAGDAYHGESDTKDWATAIDRLKKLIERKNASATVATSTV